MSISYIKDTTKYILWGKAGGRCEYDGCNRPLYYDDLTKCEFNSAYIAHIIADSPKGPRGDAVLSEKLKDDLNNLMLLCDVHHRLIDKTDVDGHPIERLVKMKQQHEERIEIQTAIGIDQRSHVLFYGGNIGKHESQLTKSGCYPALLPLYYPAQKNPIELGLKNSSFQDSTDQYWNIEEENLISLFRDKVKPLKGNQDVNHFSVFALAPIPLLIKFGTLLSDMYPAEIYQKHREPATWNWQSNSEVDDFIFSGPVNITNFPVLKFALSADIADERIHKVMGSDCSIWTITIKNPNNDFLKTRELLSKFRRIVRNALNKIKTSHGENIPLHIFPAMPVSAAVEFGRVWMPKADLPLIIYDQNTSRDGFRKALEIKKEANK